METLKYTVIKNKDQYFDYCKKLESLIDNNADQDEIDLLTVLIESFDSKNNTLNDADPVILLHSFMEDHELKAKHLSEILGLSKGYISDILNYKKGFSKDVIRKLSEYFKVNQEAFNRQYLLIAPLSDKIKKQNKIFSGIESK